MLFSCFYGVQGFEPSIKNLQEKFKADLRKIISDLLFITENNTQTLKGDCPKT